MSGADERQKELTAASDRATDLVRREAPALLAYFHRRVEVPEDAADLVSDTFVVIWRRADALPVDPIEARMWMFGIARRVLSTYRRSGIRRQALADRLRAEIATLPAPSAHDENPQLAEAFENLRPTDREIIRLVHHDGFSLAEVARLLCKRPATVRSRYQRARQRLRAELEGRPSTAESKTQDARASRSLGLRQQ
jgi:RNA polymerase sigma-70 factor (ECF subfamily)